MSSRNSPVPALEVISLSWEHVLNGISLTVAKGEIVGLGGLDGQGQSELLLALFGVLRGVDGKVLINGTQPSINHPQAGKSVQRPDGFDSGRSQNSRATSAHVDP